MKTTGIFTGKAEVYSKSRPAYPDEYIEYLIERCALKAQDTIADIGSGTGILSGQLLGRGVRVLAVEPNDDMRKTAEAELKQYKQFQSVHGAAENTGLADKSVDLITVAQAFHWFDKERFKAEAQRILKPDAKISLVWNKRDLESELIRKNEAVCKKLCPDFKGFSGGMEETSEVFETFFKNGEYEFKSFRNDLRFDLGRFIGRNLSASYAPRQADGNYQAYILALTEVFYQYSQGDEIIFPHITQSYLGQV